MKVTNFGPDGLPITLAGWSTGITSLNSNVDITGGGPSALNFVQRITSNTSNTLLNPIVNFASGANIVFGVASNTLTISGAAGGGGTVSAGSNSTRVSEDPSAGASTTLWSPYDHRHDGIGTITASSSNTMQRGTWNIRPGAGIALSLTDTDGDGEFDTATIVNTGVPGPAGSGSGSGALAVHPLPLDAYAINGTYGDDFAAASLSGIWTRRNFTSGAETYQYGPEATYIQIAMTSRAAGDGYFQTAPGGDWTFMMASISHFWTLLSWSLCVVDTVGTGLGTAMYSAPVCFLVGGITTYTTYSGTFQQTPSFPESAMVRQDRKVWQYLRKSGTNYYGAFSYDGEIWSPETPAFSSAITVDRVGMIVHPLPGIQTTAFTAVDTFNKIA